MDRQPLGSHPVLSALGGARAALKDVRDVQPVFMTTDQKRVALVEVAALAAQVAELQARLTAAAADVAEEDGARDIAAWISHTTHADLRPARADAQLAEALDARWAQVAAGMADGNVSLAQSRVIVEALDALPAGLEADKVAQAEAMLVGWCAEFRPHELKLLGKRILTYVDPDTADAADAERLQAEEQSAREKMRLTFRTQGDGTTRISGLLPTRPPRD